MVSENKSLIPQDDWYAIIDLVTQSVDSPHSKRAYSRALIDFLDWYDGNGRPGFTKATINAYREALLQSGRSRSSINQALSAIRKLAAEVADNGLVPPTLAYGVERVKGVKQEGVRAGNWLTKEETEQLINTPVIHSLAAGRDSPAEGNPRPGDPGGDGWHGAASRRSGWPDLGDDPAARRPFAHHRPGGQTRQSVLSGYSALGEGVAR